MRISEIRNLIEGRKKSSNLRLILVSVLLLMSIQLCLGSVPVWDGIMWVFLGDSITDAQQYSCYLEAFFHLRYPQYRLHFRGAGRGGATQVEGLARFEKQVYPWEPDVVVFTRVSAAWSARGAARSAMARSGRMVVRRSMTDPLSGFKYLSAVTSSAQHLLRTCQRLFLS